MVPSSLQLMSFVGSSEGLLRVGLMFLSDDSVGGVVKPLAYITLCVLPLNTVL